MTLHALRRESTTSPAPVLDGPEAGTVATITDGELYVRLNAFSQVDRFGPVRGWQVWAAASGADPVRGDWVVVERLPDGDYFLHAWEPS